MSPLWFVLIGAWSGLVLLLTGCGGNAQQRMRGDPSQEVFDACALPGVGAGMVTIETDLPADINVVTFPSDEVGLDYITQGWGATNELAAAEAHKNVAVTLERVAGGALIWARLLTPAADPRDRVKLHVRVSRDASLVIKAPKGGNITVLGGVSSVHANTSNGTITVSGVTGPVQLVTENGSINVDSFARNLPSQAQHLELHAVNGDINLFGVGANVLASTTGGNIGFVGSLYDHDNSFSTTGNGSVLITLPNDISYRFAVDSYGRVVNDFMPTTLVCAMATTAQTGLTAMSSPDLIGQVFASDPIITPTYTFNSITGLSRVGRPYLYFTTTHSLLTRLSPAGDALPNGGNAAQAWWSPDCENIKQQIEQNSQPPLVRLHIGAERGDVVLRLIRKH